MKNALQQLAETATTVMGVGFLIARSGANFARKHPVLTATSLVLFACVVYAAAEEFEQKISLIGGLKLTPPDPDHMYACYRHNMVKEQGISADGKVGYKIVDHHGGAAYTPNMQWISDLFDCGITNFGDWASVLWCQNKAAAMGTPMGDNDVTFWNEQGSGQPVERLNQVEFDSICKL